MIANLMACPSPELDERFLRHMILNSLRAQRRKFHESYGELVLCVDSRSGNWRQTVFKEYKANRRKTKEESDVDWGLIFDILYRIVMEIKENFPYHVIEVSGAEADDVIAVLARTNAAREKILILSGDKDFIQLQSIRGIKQYAPVQKKFIKTNSQYISKDPKTFLREHILRGDKGDGIPNFLSPDDTFISNKRQKQIRKANVKDWVKMDPKDFCTSEMLRCYDRNQRLVDFNYIPDNIEEKILDEFAKPPVGDRRKIFDYMVEKRLNNLVQSIEDF